MYGPNGDLVYNLVTDQNICEDLNGCGSFECWDEEEETLWKEEIAKEEERLW